MVNSNNKIADAITKHPYLKNKLIERNKIFKNLNNPVVLNTVGKFARISDVARISSENLEELLVFINRIVDDEESK